MRRLINKIIFKTIIPLIFIAAGIFASVLTIGAFNSSKDFPETTATITAINKTYNAAEESYDYQVEVDYSYEGVDYHSLLGEYTSSYKVGDEVTIKVNPENPDEITGAGSLGLIIGLALGGIFIIVGASIFFKNLFRF